MTQAHRRIALLAALAIAASVFAHAPAAGGQTAQTAPAQAPPQSQDAGVHQPSIDALVELQFDSFAGVDLFAGTGCADSDQLCPGEDLPRWETAVWLARIHDRSDPPATGSSRFADVDPDAWWSPHAERLAELGIIEECATDPLRFCPDDPVDRGQMAAYLARAFDLDQGVRAGFADVPADHAFADDIDRLAVARITAGCGRDPARYCPRRNVTRGETATFLARAIGVVHPAEPVPAHDHTPLPVDPAVTIGTLDNGLTYYLRHNDSPMGKLDVRLIINLGSVDETDEEAGIGHFIEHMLFNGTGEYPGNSLGAALRDIGVELGPDLNAHVSHDETVYEVEVQTDDPAKVALVFHALSQMAGAATLEDAAVESERGVILDEMRLGRESVDGVILAGFDHAYTRGTHYEGRDPIGTLETVNSMTPEMLRAFYAKWYVPANMALVAVGDMAAEDLQALVEEHFGPLPPGEGRRPPGIDITPDPESSSHVITDPRRGYSYISLDIPIAPHDLSTVGGDRLSTMESLIKIIIDNRLNDAYHRGELSQVDPPSFTSFTYNRGLRFYGTNWRGDNLDTASTDYLSVLLTAQEHGFTAGDLQRAAAQKAVFLQLQLANAASTQHGQYADRYEKHYLYGADISAVESSVARTLALLAEFTPEELTEHYRWQMERGGLLAIAVGPDPSAVPTAAELDAALAAAEPGPPPPEEAAVTELMAAPVPVEPVSEGSGDLLPGAYQWEFANGARVVFAPSDIAAGIVNVQAQSLGGWSVLQPGDRGLSAIALDAVRGSGVGDLTRPQLNRFLENEAVSLSAYIREAVEGFQGGASVDDIGTLFQLLHLLVTAPRVEDLAYDDAINTAEERATLAETDPRFQASVAYWEARFGDTWHRIIASREEIASLTPQRLLSLYESRLGSVDDMVVAVVGDIDVTVIDDLARRYIGTLPAGEPGTYANRRRPMPSGVVQREIKLTEGESAILAIYQESDLEVTPLRAVATDVLSTALSARLFLTIREELGSSYVAGAQIDTATVPEHVIDSWVFATLDPDRYDEVYSTVLAILADVAASGLTPEEFAQAMAVLESDYSTTTNGHLLGVLLSEPLVGAENVLTQDRRARLLAGVTPEDVQALAAALYGEGGRIEVIRRP
ncbi:MAG: insulinase family protein [Acidimicrobiaceae bacterium]|nr:insulinase family protein [Acidimicrobiaceae bacterium]